MGMIRGLISFFFISSTMTILPPINGHGHDHHHFFNFWTRIRQNPTSSQQQVLQLHPGVSDPIPIIWSFPLSNSQQNRLLKESTTTVQPPRKRRRNRYLCDQIYEADWRLIPPENQKQFRDCCYSFPKSTFSCANGDSICWREPKDSVPKCCGGGCWGSKPNFTVHHQDDLLVVPPRSIHECDHLSQNKDGDDGGEFFNCCRSFPNFVFSCNGYQNCLNEWASCCSSCGGAGTPIQKSTPRPTEFDVDYYD